MNSPETPPEARDGAHHPGAVPWPTPRLETASAAHTEHSATWRARFLGLAQYVASWSKDPSTQCGAVIVDSHRRIVSCGYNGPPAGIDDHLATRDRNTKLAITLHAEHNAILFAQRDLSDCTLYVWPMPPCAHCAAQIVQCGISTVVCGKPTDAQRKRWGESWKLANELFTQAGVTIQHA